MKTPRRYTAALRGTAPVWNALRTALASRFGTVQARVLVPATSERLDLSVAYSPLKNEDTVTLTARNWSTGASRTLYSGPLTTGQSPRNRIKE